MTKVAIIILHYGDPLVTNNCLEALSKLNNKSIKHEIYVLDNQGTIKRHSNKANIHYFPYKTNLGFASGNNFVINKIKYKGFDYCVFLNNDTVPTPGFLDKLLNPFTLNGSIGIAGPVIEHKVRETIRYDYGGKIYWNRGQPKHENRDVYDSTTDFIDRDFVSGCCLAIRSELFHKLRGFNEDYFMYLEDVDLCIRAKKLGAGVVCVPGSKIFHLGSKSATENFKIKQSLINGIRFSLTHVRGIYKVSALLFNLAFYPALWMRWKLSKLKRSFKEATFS